MKEIKDVAPSVLVLIVTANDDEAAVEAFRSDARNYLEKPGRKNILPGPRPGTPSSTIQEYLNGCRIAKAKNLLRTGYRSITEIAISLGFADSTGFGRIFKKLTGQTPSAYRSLARK